MLPRRQVHVAKADLNLLTDGELIQSAQVVIFGIEIADLAKLITDVFTASGFLELCYGVERAGYIASQGPERQPERSDRAFQTLQQVGGHQRLKAALAISLSQFAAAAFDLRIVDIFVLP